MEDGEDSASLMKEEQIDQVFWTENTGYHSKEAGKESGTKVGPVIALFGHLRRPYLGCETSKQRKEDYTRASKLMSKWRIEESSTC